MEEGQGVQSLLNYPIKKLKFGWEHALACIGVMQIIFLIVILAGVVSIGAPVTSTLNDVNKMMPEMNMTIIELGELVPDIRRATKILDIICEATPSCF